MKCHGIEEQITPYLLGDLEQAQAEEVRLHLEACESCRALVQEIEPTLDILRDALAADSGVPIRLDPERVEQIKQPRSARVFVLWSAHSIRLAQAAAVVLLLGGMMAWLLLPRLQRPLELAEFKKGTANLGEVQQSVREQYAMNKRAEESLRINGKKITPTSHPTPTGPLLEVEAVEAHVEEFGFLRADQPAKPEESMEMSKAEIKLHRALRDADRVENGAALYGNPRAKGWTEKDRFKNRHMFGDNSLGTDERDAETVLETLSSARPASRNAIRYFEAHEFDGKGPASSEMNADIAQERAYSRRVESAPPPPALATGEDGSGVYVAGQIADAEGDMLLAQTPDATEFSSGLFFNRERGNKESMERDGREKQKRPNLRMRGLRRSFRNAQDDTAEHSFGIMSASDFQSLNLGVTSLALEEKAGQMASLKQEVPSPAVEVVIQ